MQNINFEDISVVVQGPIDKLHTAKCLKNIRKKLPGAKIVLSTWEDSEVEGLEYDTIVYSKDPGPSFVGSFVNNVNRQIVSTKNGLDAVNTKYAIKIRSDIMLHSNKFLNYFDKFNNKSEEFNIFEKRIITYIYTTKFIFFGEAAPFHVGDWFYFGLASDLRKLFDIPIQNNEEDEYFGKGFPDHQYVAYRAPFRYHPEQYIGYHALKAAHPEVKFEHRYDISDKIIATSRKFFANNFIVLSHFQLPITLMKKNRNEYKGYSNLYWKGCINFFKWEKLYKYYCDPTHETSRLKYILYLLYVNFRHAISKKFYKAPRFEPEPEQPHLIKDEDFMKKNILMISGAYTSGKGVLSALLEGHTNIVAIPHWHDMLADIFLRFLKSFMAPQNESSWRGHDERIILLKKYLSHQDYPMLEHYAMQKKIPFQIAAGEFIFSDFDVDFYKHEKEFFTGLFALERDSISISKLFELFYQSLIENWKGHKGNFNKVKYFVSASEPGFCNYKELFKNEPATKVIYIRRTAKDWILPLMHRIRQYECNYDAVIKRIFYLDPRMKYIVYMDRNCEKIAEKYPENFKIIEFDDLIERTDETMQAVGAFLGISITKSLFVPTFQGEILETEKYKLIGETIDNESKIDIPSRYVNRALEIFENYETIVLQPKPQKKRFWHRFKHNKLVQSISHKKQKLKKIFKVCSPF